MTCEWCDRAGDAIVACRTIGEVVMCRQLRAARRINIPKRGNVPKQTLLDARELVGKDTA